MAVTQDQPSRARRGQFLARALAHRNYRLYFVGQGISLNGTWMTRLATGWLVFRLAGDDAAFLLGLVGFAGQVPTFFLAPLADVLAWNLERLRTMVRPIYRRLGILPEIAGGMQAASELTRPPQE